MKKIFKKSNIFSFLLGAIIFGGIVGVSAYTILATDIGYTPSDSTWKKTNGENITNVKDAIDELYLKTNNSMFEHNYVDFNLSKSSTATITLSPNNYRYLYLFNTYWFFDKKDYDSIIDRLKIKQITNAEYKEIGVVGRNGVSSSSASKIYMIKVEDINSDVTITFNSTVDSVSVYGIN